MKLKPATRSYLKSATDRRIRSRTKSSLFYGQRKVLANSIKVDRKRFGGKTARKIWGEQGYGKK